MQPSAEARAADFPRKLLLWGTVMVSAHFAVVIWHAVLLVRVQPDIPGLAIVGLILINLVPLAGLVAFAKGLSKSAGVMIVIPLGLALVIGVYAHFLSAGSDNVLQMPASTLKLPFQISAVLLASLEALGCWVGFRMFARASIVDLTR